MYASPRRGFSLWTRCHLGVVTIMASAIIPTATGWSEELPPVESGSPTRKDLGEATTWEEPNMFPQETALEDKYFPRPRQAPTEPREIAADPLSPAQTESLPQHAATTFQTDFGNVGYAGAPALGLGSTRDRDALMALSRGNVVSQPYNIKIGPIPLRLSAGLDLTA